ncbi:hypothetical protein C5L15_000346, partial [Lactococcus lactis subsp. lactis]
RSSGVEHNLAMVGVASSNLVVRLLVLLLVIYKNVICRRGSTG